MAENQLRQNVDLVQSRSIMKDHSVNEIIDVRHAVIPPYKTVVDQGKKGFFGIGAEPEKRKQVVDRWETPLHSELVEGGKNEPCVEFTYLVASRENYNEEHGRPRSWLISPFYVARINSKGFGTNGR